MGSGYITERREKKAAFAPSPGFPGGGPSGTGTGLGAPTWGSNIGFPGQTTVNIPQTANQAWRMPPLGPAGAFLRAAQELAEAQRKKDEEPGPQGKPGELAVSGAFKSPHGWRLEGCACDGNVMGYRVGAFISFACSTNVFLYPDQPNNGWNPATGNMAVGERITTWRFNGHYSGAFASYWRVCQYVKDANPASPWANDGIGPHTTTAWPYGHGFRYPRYAARYPSRIIVFEEFEEAHNPGPVGSPERTPGTLPFRWWTEQPTHAPDGTPTRWNDWPIERPINPPTEWPGSDHPWRVPHPGSWPDTARPTHQQPWPGFGQPTRPSQWPSRTVTLRIGANGNFTITGRPTVHNRNYDPRKGPKGMPGPIIAAIAKKTGLAAASEGCDTIENAYDALPRKYKRRTWKGSNPPPRGWKQRKISCTAQARQVSKYLSEINQNQSKAKQTVIDEFTKNFVMSQFADFVMGRTSRAAGRGLNKLGYRGSSTFGTGPGATGQGYGL